MLSCATFEESFKAAIQGVILPLCSAQVRPPQTAAHGQSPGKGHKDDQGTAESLLWGKQTAETDTPGEGLGEILCTNIWRESAKMEPGTSWWRPVMGPEAKGTNWNTGGSPWTSGNTFTRTEAPAQVAQRDWGISSVRGTQKPTGHNPGLEEALPEPLGWTRGPPELPTSTILWGKGWVSS